MKLISMVEFVKEDWKTSNKGDLISETDNYRRLVKYANFLSQPLTLGMFVPCSVKGEYVLDEVPIIDSGNEAYLVELNEYQQAKERVLFDNMIIEDDSGIKWVKNGDDFGCKLIRLDKETPKFWEENIEQMIKYNLTLTPLVIKQLEL